MGADLKGRVLRIERTSIHDGSGLRTVVFLKGCPLRCSWCSTPESQNLALERGYRPNLCRLCTACVKNCPAGALKVQDGSIARDPVACTGCFVCARVCLHAAVQIYGATMRVSEVIEEIVKDEIFYFHSGGGVTISGGECLLQPDFVAEILAECRLRGIDTALETSLFASWRVVERVIPHLNTFFVDIKHPVSDKHQRYTGAGNEIILANLRRLDRHPASFTVHLRLPLIPGINDSDTDLKGAVDLAQTLRRGVDLEILPYHRLGMDTYTSLGRDYEFAAIATPSPEYIRERLSFIRTLAAGLTVKVGGGFDG